MQADKSLLQLNIIMQKKQQEKIKNQEVKLKQEVTIYEQLFHDLNINQKQEIVNQYNEHGFVCLFHLLFKLIPFLIYLVDEIFRIKGATIIITQLVTIFAVIDFWYTKNVSGRYLVGLRWWIDEDENQNQFLKIECRINDAFNPKITSKIFWFGLIIYSLGTAVILIFSFWRISFQNISLAIIMIIFGGINIWCFFKARKQQGEKIDELQSKIGNKANLLLRGSIVAYV